jgi:CRISPR-associated protein Cas2
MEELAELDWGETDKTNSCFVAVIYDITDNKRRIRLSKLISGYGERVQGSAFECWLTKNELAELECEALSIIDENNDSLIIYRMNGSSGSKRYGVAPETYEKSFILV